MAKRKRNPSVEVANESGAQHQKKLKAENDANPQSQDSARSPGPQASPSQAQRKRKQRRLRKLARQKSLAAAQGLLPNVVDDASKTRLPDPPKKQWVNEVQKASQADATQSPQINSTKTAPGKFEVDVKKAARDGTTQDDEKPQTPKEKGKRKPRKPESHIAQPANEFQATTDTAPAVMPTVTKPKGKLVGKAGHVSGVNFGKHPEQALQKLSEFLGDDDSSDSSSDDEPKNRTQQSKPSQKQKPGRTPKVGTEKAKLSTATGGKASNAQDGASETQTSALREIGAARNPSTPGVRKDDEWKPGAEAEAEAETHEDSESDVEDESESSQRTESGWSIFKPSTWFSRSKLENDLDTEVHVLTEEISNIRSLRSGRTVVQSRETSALSPSRPSVAAPSTQVGQTSSPKQWRSGRAGEQTTPDASARRTKRTVVMDIGNQTQPVAAKPSSSRSLRSWRSFDHSPTKELPTPRAAKRTPTRRTSTKSEYFLPLDRVDLPTPGRRRAPAGVSVAPVPPVSNQHFGIIQEKLWREPFWMLVAVILLNKTTGRAAIPTFWKIREKYPDPRHLSAADQQELADMIYYCGLFNQRSKSLIKLASVWHETPPTQGVRWRTLHYPKAGDGKDFSAKQCVEGDVDDCTGALEIAHLPGCGRYAYDSWRIFCRDVLRGVAEDYNGAGAVGDGFESEWKRVSPEDKELRATVRWMWLREGWIWNHETGEKRRATEEEMARAVLGEMDVPDQDELKFAAIATRKDLPIE